MHIARTYPVTQVVISVLLPRGVGIYESRCPNRGSDRVCTACDGMKEYQDETGIPRHGCANKYTSVKANAVRDQACHGYDAVLYTPQCGRINTRCYVFASMVSTSVNERERLPLPVRAVTIR